MPGTVYFIRNQDLYKIGITSDLDRRMKELEPDEVMATMVTAYFQEYEKELHSRYKHCRIPQTEYFRLSAEEVKEVLFELTGDGVPRWVSESKGMAKYSWLHTLRSFGLALLVVLGAGLLNEYVITSSVLSVLVGIAAFVGFLYFMWNVILGLWVAVGYSIKGLFDWGWWKFKENK
jgi:hypothetical protein